MSLTSSTHAAPVARSEVEDAISLGLRAPSVHNTQPWQWRILHDGFELYADESRQLSGTDPDQHDLLISCGAALELARLGMASHGWSTDVQRWPSAADPTLLARVRATVQGPADAATIGRTAAAWRRRSERRPFDRRQVSDAAISAVVSRAADRGVYLCAISSAEELLGLTVVTSQADRDEIRDPGYRADLAAWTGADGNDGVPANTVPRLARAVRESDLTLRDFELASPGTQPIVQGEVERPLVFGIFTDGENRAAWLAAGEALGRTVTEMETLGLAGAPFTQPVDWPQWRSRLRGLMNWTGYPQFFLRAGWPPDDLRHPVTPRRPLGLVLR